MDSINIKINAFCFVFLLSDGVHASKYDIAIFFCFGLSGVSMNKSSLKR